MVLTNASPLPVYGSNFTKAIMPLCHCEPLLPLCLFTRVVKQSKIYSVQELWKIVNHVQFGDCCESPAAHKNGSLDRFVPRDDRKQRVGQVLLPALELFPPG